MGVALRTRSLNFEQHPFLKADVVIDLSNSIINTFMTAVGIRSHFDDLPFAQMDWQPCNDLSVSIDIKSNTHSGQIRFHFNKDALTAVIKKLFNEAQDPSGAEISDCLGELSNICSGNAKTKLNEKGFNLKAALPSVASKTSDLPRLAAGQSSVVIPFKILEHECQMQIIVFK